MSKKILFPFVGDSFGGSHKSSILLIKHLIHLGFKPHVVLHSKGEQLEEQLRINHIEFDYLKLDNLAGTSPNLFQILISFIMNMRKIIFYVIKHQPEIIHGNDLRINLSWGLATKLACKKYVWHQRTILSKSKKWNFMPLLANHFIAISNFVGSSLPRTIKRKNQSVIYNPIEFKRKEIPKKGLSDEFKFLYLGRIVPEKSIELLIKLASELNKKNHKFKIHFVGKGRSSYIDSLRVLSKELNVNKFIEFIGFSHFPEDHIHLADCVISPGENEGLGRSVLEAMACNTIVIASNSGAHKEIIQHKKNGFLFLPNDVFDLAGQADYVINNNTQDIIENANKFCRDNFSTSNHATRIKSVYEKII